MSDPVAPQSTYDPNEIRRCIALCFSPNDLRTFAEGLGVTGLGAWPHGIQDGAREVVRHFERLGTLDQLVAKLAEARPLMEWPAPTLPTSASAFIPPAPTPAIAAPPVTAPPVAETTPAPTENPAPFAPPLDYAPAPAPPAKTVVTPTISAPQPVLRDPFAPAFPGTSASAAATNQKRLDGKKFAPILIGAVALISIITIGVFLAVRVGKNPEPTAPEMVAGRPLRPNGPARMAADAMRRSLDSLARGCDLEVPRGTDVGAWLFPAAYAQCGTRLGIAFPPPGLRVNAPRSTNKDDFADDPSNSAPNTPRVNTPRQTNPAPRPAPAPAPAKPAVSDGCVDKCSATQRQCNRGCGSEPTSSAEYDRWQGCQTQCLSAASKCRLACQ